MLYAGHTIHPSKALPGNHLEVDTLVTILGIYQVREFHGIELILGSASENVRSIGLYLLGHNAIEINESSCHPAWQSVKLAQLNS